MADEGDQVIFSVVASGYPSPQYQWQINEQDIEGAVTQYLVLDSVTVNHVAEYRVIVYNDSGSVTSQPASLAIRYAPVITSTFTDRSGGTGENVSFHVSASGVPPPEFQWYHNAAPINGAIDSVYTIPSVSFSDSGMYWVDAANELGTVYSDTFHFEVYDKPQNNAIIWGSYPGDGGDSAFVFLGNLQNIDSNKVDSVLLFCSWQGSLAAFDSIAVSFDSVRAAAADSNIFRWKLTNQSFTDSVQIIKCSVILIGMNGVRSDTQTSSFAIGIPIPDNPLSLSASPLDHERIEVRWSRIAIADFDSVKLWYDLGRINRKGSGADTVVSPVDSVVEVGNLDPLTLYHFGAQVALGGIWSDVSDSARASEMTTELDTTPLVNTITVTRSWFSEERNALMIGWSVEMVPDSHMAIGAVYATGGYSDLSSPSTDTITVSSDTGVFVIELGESISFNTLYYVSLLLRIGSGEWLKPLPPVYSARTTVSTPDYTWQPLIYFRKNETNVSLFNDNVIVEKTKNFSDSLVDTLDIVESAPTPSGLTPLSISFEFRRGEKSSPLLLHVRYEKGLIPPAADGSLVRLYRYDTRRDMWLIDTTSYTDTLLGVVYVSLENKKMPFRVMLDTQPPQVHFGDTSRIFIDNEDQEDTMYVSDNIGNVIVRHLYNQADKALQEKKLTVLDSTYARVLLPIDGKYIKQDYGLRSQVTVSDGVNRATYDISHRIFRDAGADAISTDENVWTPLHVCSSLDSTSVGRVLDTLGGTPWEYDQTEFRLFRWCPLEPVSSIEGTHWIEYSALHDSLFTFLPGRLFWIKTRKRTQIGFGSGVTPSLKHPHAIPLKALSWTDFALPCKFGITIGDILDSSGGGADTLQFYKWQDTLVNRKHRYIGKLVYGSALPLKKKRDEVLGADMQDGFTVYNPHPGDMTLRIPYIPVAMSKYGSGSNKQTVPEGYNFVINAVADSTIPLGEVYCSYIESGNTAVVGLPALRRFSPVTITVASTDTTAEYGHLVYHGHVGEGFAYRLTVRNNSDSPHRVDYRIKALNERVPGLRSGILSSDNPDSLRPLGKLYTERIDANSEREFWLVAGTDEYIRGMAEKIRVLPLGLFPLYPNPVHRTVTIRYSVPPDGVERISFSVFDVLGRSVWNRSVAAGRSGVHTISWNLGSGSGERVAAGLYVLRMNGFDSTGKRAGTFETRFTLLQ
jgi:hypothetical protein